jgi:hypothetical protein
VQAATETILPDSPFDEEVAFNVLDDEDADTVEELSRFGNSTLLKMDTNNQFVNELVEQAPSNLRSSSAQRPRHSYSSFDSSALLNRETARRSKSAGHASRRSSFGGISGTASAESRVLELQALVEDMIRGVVKKTDLYHVVQVSPYSFQVQTF